MNTTRRQEIILKSENKLAKVFLWLFNQSKKFLSKHIRTSNNHILAVGLIILTLVFIILLLIICLNCYQRRKLKYKHRMNSLSHRFHHTTNTNSTNHRAILDLQFNCQNHKCLCQYSRRAHSTLNLTKSTSIKSITMSNMESRNDTRPLLIKPTELRYAKIKQLSSTKDLNHNYLPGQFRTIVRLKSLPD